MLLKMLRKEKLIKKLRKQAWLKRKLRKTELTYDNIFI
tara:strand:+ start:701 stop:814 length:114 start_codon:yes stop_codon:yes gene_type:complete